MDNLDEILRTAQLANYLYTRMVDFLVTLILVSLDLFSTMNEWMAADSRYKYSMDLYICVYRGVCV